MYKTVALAIRSAHTGKLSWLAALSGLLAGIALNFELMTCIGLAAVAFSAAWYLDALGEEIAIVPLAAFIASAQWILGPIIAYNSDVQLKYRMYVPEDEYMTFVVPALLAFIVCLSWTAPYVSIRSLQERIRAAVFVSDGTIFKLMIVSIIFEYLGRDSPSQLSFFFFLLGQLKYVAAIYLLINRSRWRWPVVAFVMLTTLMSSAGEGQFHDVILWSAFLFSFVCYDLRLKIWGKLAVIGFGIMMLISLQTIKAQYRATIEFNPEKAGILTLASAIEDALFNSAQNDDSTVTARLNEGWIISAVMAYTPSSEPFAGGDTVTAALHDSLVPRFLSDKRNVTISDNFRKFTGLNVGENTSFGISIVGEAWANYGQFGILLLAFWGVAFGSVLRLMAWQGNIHPTLPLWMPMIFLYAVKAETELVAVLNYLVKASFFVLLVYFITWRILKIRI